MTALAIAPAASAAGGMPIRLDRCAKTWPDGTRALEPLDLDIAAGETLVLLGPSGCGKTTTLRLIAGLEPPDPGGRVLFGGEDVTDQPIERRHIGMVFQNYALFPNMSVAENVGYGLRIRGVGRVERDRRVRDMLAMMHIDKLADRRTDQLSGGQRQRVALARALAVRPRALLLDEPMTALDAKLREALRLEIDGLLRGLGVTTVYVTHDQAEAMALGDRIVVMSHGQVAQIGTPRQVYHQPANRFVAEFVGTMNRLPAVAGDGWLRIAGSRWPWAGAAGPLEILFRPEDVALTDPDGALLTGSVAACSFLGDKLRLLVTLAGPPAGQGEGDPAVRPLVIETDGRRAVAIGQAVGLTLDPARWLALPA